MEREDQMDVPQQVESQKIPNTDVKVTVKKFRIQGLPLDLQYLKDSLVSDNIKLSQVPFFPIETKFMGLCIDWMSVVPDPHPPSRPLPPPPKDDSRQPGKPSTPLGNHHAHPQSSQSAHGQQQRSSHAFKPMVNFSKPPFIGGEGRDKLLTF